MATDVDALTTLAWSVAGNDSGNFTITKNAAGHGELKFKNVPNYEMPTDTGGDNKYNVDGDGLRRFSDRHADRHRHRR